jgi:hypothetical protein
MKNMYKSVIEHMRDIREDRRVIVECFKEIVTELKL